ncbi:uncharacterized protein LOC112687787 [Sipha flava]|uniref:Uncharacterized protein LOC112687787 n=1 Tax=Sipha flava TaxID=143950 RepID=A0A8B8G0F2_9HEMI|nr:uncharacterized protein LOC112687787 [Sipha flava]
MADDKNNRKRLSTEKINSFFAPLPKKSLTSDSLPIVPPVLIIQDHLRTGETNNILDSRNQPFISDELKTPSNCTIDIENQLTNSKIMSYDVGEFIGKSIDDNTKQQLLLNHWKPPNNYEFPYSEHNKIYKNKIDKRYASQKHLNKFEWLVLSDKLKGYFCKYCFLFATKGGCKKQTPLNQLVVNSKTVKQFF